MRRWEVVAECNVPRNMHTKSDECSKEQVASETGREDERRRGRRERERRII